MCGGAGYLAAAALKLHCLESAALCPATARTALCLAAAPQQQPFPQHTARLQHTASTHQSIATQPTTTLVLPASWLSPHNHIIATQHCINTTAIHSFNTVIHSYNFATDGLNTALPQIQYLILQHTDTILKHTALILLT